MYVYLCTERGERRGDVSAATGARPGVTDAHMSVVQQLLCMDRYTWCVYMCLACVPAENISTASLPVGPGDMEQRLPRLSRAAGYIFL